MGKKIFLAFACVLFFGNSCLAVTIDYDRKKSRDAEWIAILLRDRAKLEKGFRTLWCKRLPPMELHGYCKGLHDFYHGSRVNCYNCTGIWNDGLLEMHYEKRGNLVKFVHHDFGAYVIEYNYHNQYIVMKVYDNSGNFVSVKMSGAKNTPPEKYAFSVLDAHLPDLVNTAVSFVSRKGNPSLAVKRNALISLLNDGYRHAAQSYLFYVIDLVTNQHFREQFLDAAPTWY